MQNKGLKVRTTVLFPLYLKLSKKTGCSESWISPQSLPSYISHPELQNSSQFLLAGTGREPDSDGVICLGHLGLICIISEL